MNWCFSLEFDLVALVEECTTLVVVGLVFSFFAMCYLVVLLEPCVLLSLIDDIICYELFDLDLPRFDCLETIEDFLDKNRLWL